MNPSHPAPVDGSASEVVRVLDAYLSGIEAGQPADPDKLLADHPALADQLRAYLQVMNLAGRLAADSHAQPEFKAAGSSTGGSSPPAGSSLLTTLDLGPGGAPHIQLRDLLDDREPLVMPRSAEMPDPDGAGPGRYQLQGEIARGGMGAILKGRDVELGRDLAIKVLLESHRGNPEVVRRFVEEAQIGGQLQHPGVVPVYELGTFPEPDQRPYFAMKLVKGRTLAALLHDRTGPAQDLPRFLSIFEQVCQTVAYAHARGVIHRDLKPSNVMVGSFGEVQVMDWGLAKVLPQGGIADEAAAQPVPETAIVTVRSGPAGSGSESQAGSVLGTPSYMAPEQARGEVGRIDERADVFGLGAILCEILTGRPPFWGSTREEIRARAARGDLADALGRLDTSGADGDLVDLARDCLAAQPERRPRSAGEVARQLTTYLAGVQERLKTAELARVEAQARAEEETKRRRLTVALAAAVLGLLVLGGSGWAHLAQQRAERLAATTRVVTEALAEAERLRGQAQLAVVGDLTKWSDAVGAAKHAHDLVAEGEADDALRNRVESAMADIERDQTAAQQRATEVERDRTFLGELETIRISRSDHWDSKRTDADYGAAFRGFGIDLDQLDAREAGKRIVHRSVPAEFVSYLDDWALQRRKARSKEDALSWKRLLQAAQVADPNPWRVALRDHIERGDHDAIQRLAADQKALEAQSIRGLLVLASALNEQGNGDRAEIVLRRAWRRAPGDFWLNFELGVVCVARLGPMLPDRPPLSEEAIRFYSVSVAIRPRSFAAHNSLAGSLGNREEAVAEFREAVRLKPDHHMFYRNLGNSLKARGAWKDAIDEYREAIRLKPDDNEAHFGLGNTLRLQGKLGEATAELREALRISPDDHGARNNLGIALKDQGKLEEAIAEYRKVLRVAPDHAQAHHNLAITLRLQGDYAAAVDEFRKARQLARNDPAFAERIQRQLTATEQSASHAARLPDLLAGKSKPADAAESIAVAEVAHAKKLYGASARFWQEAFRTQPALADDVTNRNRYNAACAAAKAGCGHGKDDPPLNDATRARWRTQAIGWLSADATVLAKMLQTGPPQARELLSKKLRLWKLDPDLAGLRDQAALARLSEDEQKACRALWAEVDALLAKSQGTNPKSGH